MYSKRTERRKEEELKSRKDMYKTKRKAYNTYERTTARKERGAHIHQQSEKGEHRQTDRQTETGRDYSSSTTAGIELQVD